MSVRDIAIAPLDMHYPSCSVERTGPSKSYAVQMSEKSRVRKDIGSVVEHYLATLLHSKSESHNALLGERIGQYNGV